MKNLIFIVTIFIVLLGCKKDSPKSPSAATLLTPAKNSECTPIQSSGDDSSVVRFSWSASDNTESYELRVTNLESGTVQTKTTRNLIETLSLVKGTPFSWQVISHNTKTSKTASSESWFFFNPGSETSYVPFPAEIKFPSPGTTVFRNINNEVELAWEGADLDDDIERYEIYFSTENPPATLLASLGSTATARNVSVEEGQVYYWKVVTTDAEGHVSDSGVVDFKTR